MTIIAPFLGDLVFHLLVSIQWSKDAVNAGKELTILFFGNGVRVTWVLTLE